MLTAIREMFTGVGQNGETALHAGALFGHLKVVSQLLGAGVPPEIKNKVHFLFVGGDILFILLWL